MVDRLHTILLTGNALLVAIALLSEPHACWATTLLDGPTALSTLIANPSASIAAGDKLFSGFQYFALGSMPAPGVINVFSILDDEGYLCIRFQGPFGDLPGGSDADASVRYAVATADQGFVQTGAKLTGDPTAGTGSFFGVDQSFQGSNTVLSTFASGLEPSPLPP